MNTSIIQKVRKAFLAAISSLTYLQTHVYKYEYIYLRICSCLYSTEDVVHLVYVA